MAASIEIYQKHQPFQVVYNSVEVLDYPHPTYHPCWTHPPDGFFFVCVRQRRPDCIQLTDVPLYLADFVKNSAVTVMIFVSVSVNKNSQSCC